MNAARSFPTQGGKQWKRNAFIRYTGLCAIACPCPRAHVFIFVFYIHLLVWMCNVFLVCSEHELLTFWKFNEMAFYMLFAVSCWNRTNHETTSTMCAHFIWIRERMYTKWLIHSEWYLVGWGTANSQWIHKISCN